jgi:hypothetical protein
VNKYKSAIVVMARNPYRYLAEFIAHHGNIVDAIFLINHQSDRCLRDIDIDGVFHIESNQAAQFQSEVTNAVIRDYELYKNYDWIFVLDVDEFLPFNNRYELNKFFDENICHRIVSFHWLNGVGVYPSVSSDNLSPFSSLVDVSPVFISKVKNSNIKVCVNCRKLRYPFYFGTGAHQVVKPLWINSISSFKNLYRSIIPHASGSHINHIVAYDKKSFYEKIENYVEQMEMRKHVLGQGGWMVKNYLTNFDDKEWLFAIQNYRITNPKLQTMNVTEELFERKDIFSHISLSKIAYIKSFFQRVKMSERAVATLEEARYLKNKKFDTDIQENIKNFKVIKLSDYSRVEIELHSQAVDYR